MTMANHHPYNREVVGPPGGIASFGAETALERRGQRDVCGRVPRRAVEDQA
jgi:hypothetical protein